MSATSDIEWYGMVTTDPTPVTCSEACDPRGCGATCDGATEVCC